MAVTVGSMSFDPSLFEYAQARMDAGATLAARPRAQGHARPDLPPPLPPVMPEPVVARRPRGIYVASDPPPGTVVLLVYDHREDRISRAEIAARVYTAATFDAFRAWLDAVDPMPAVLRLA